MAKFNRRDGQGKSDKEISLRQRLFQTGNRIQRSVTA